MRITNSTALRSTRRQSATRAALALLAAGAVSVGALQAGCGGKVADEKPVKVSTIEFISAADFSDDRRLAGFAQDVFIGRVAGEGRTVAKEPVLETDFSVDVVETIKGSAKGNVVVAQTGGYLPGGAELRLMEGDQLLESGRTYLFATRTDAEGRRLLVPQFGDVRVQSPAHETELRERFTAASRSPLPAPLGG
jgi:hypothetical protein